MSNREYSNQKWKRPEQIILPISSAAHFASMLNNTEPLTPARPTEAQIVPLPFIARWLSVLLLVAFNQAGLAADGILSGTSAGGAVTAGNYGVLMSLGQPGPVGTASSTHYQLLGGYVPASEVAPTASPPPTPVLTGATEGQAFAVNGSDLANLLQVSDPDGLGYQFQFTASAGELRRNGATIASATLGQADDVDWMPPSGQSGSIAALLVVLKRGNYPDVAAVSVSVSVAAVNDPPVAVNDAASGNEDAAITGNVLANDTDPEDGELTALVGTQPQNGTLTLGSDGAYQYMPDANWNGADSFTYTAKDVDGLQAIATVTLTVAAADTPQQVTQSISLVEGWNLVSLYAQPDDMKPSTVFSGHFDVIEEMRTLQGVFNTSWPDFLNMIQQLNLADSYWIKSNTARSGITVTGAPPTSTDISLGQGWNLIGFPSVGSQETAAVFQSLADNNAIERVIGTSEFYWFDSNAVFNDLSSLKPGDGYWVKMHSAATLTVNSVPANDEQNGGRRLAKAGGNNKLDELKQSLVAYPSVPAICIVEIRADGRLAVPGSLLAAYVGDELRGVQQIRFQNGRMIVPIVIQSSQPAQVRFRLWHAGLGKWFEVAERIETDSGDALGMDGNGPVVLNVTAPWPSAPGLALRQQPLRLLVRHESDRKFVVEQSRNLKEWVLRWQLTGTDEWRELLIPPAGTRGYFRVRALD